MSQRNYLFKNSFNSLLDRFSQYGELDKVLESEGVLADELKVSRSTVHNVILELMKVGILKSENKKKVFVRRPKKDDYFELSEHPQSQSDRVEARFIQKLLSGELPQGSNFSERELAREYECTTITIREVLLKVSHSGLIKKNPRQSWQVVTIDKKMIDDIYEARQLLEVVAIEKLIELAGDNQIWAEIDRLISVHLDAQKQMKQEVALVAQLDVDFHGMLYKAIDNLCLNTWLDSMSTMIHFHQMHNALKYDSSHKMTIRDHLNILEALKRRDKESAVDLLQDHLHHSYRYIMSLAHTGN